MIRLVKTSGAMWCDPESGDETDEIALSELLESFPEGTLLVIAIPDSEDFDPDEAFEGDD